MLLLVALLQSMLLLLVALLQSMLLLLVALLQSKLLLLVALLITEHATSGEDPHLEKMFQEACSNAPRNMEILLQELHALGRYPNRYKQPAGEVEKDSNRLAKKLATARSSFTPAVQKYVEELALAGYVEQAQRKRPASEALIMKSLAPAITAHSHSAATEHV